MRIKVLVSGWLRRSDDLMAGHNLELCLAQSKYSNPIPQYFTFITVLQGKCILDEETEVNDQIMYLRPPPAHLSEPKCSVTLLLVCSSQSLHSNGASRALCLGRGSLLWSQSQPCFHLLWVFDLLRSVTARSSMNLVSGFLCRAGVVTLVTNTELGGH